MNPLFFYYIFTHPKHKKRDELSSFLAKAPNEHKDNTI